MDFQLDLNGEGTAARRHFSGALMSDTKWRKLIEAVRAAWPEKLSATVRFVGLDEPKTMRFPPALLHRPYMDTIEFGPVALRAIEWLELPADLTAVLEPIGEFPVEVNGGRTRIFGYSHPAK